MKPSTNKILVVGLGNRLRADDGLGLKVVDKLKEEDLEVSTLKIGTSPINYLQEISHSENIIAIDAIQGGNKAGSIYQLTLADINQHTKQHENAHSYSLPQVIKLAQEINDLPNNVIFYGMEPSSLELINQLSYPIKEKLPLLIKKIKLTINKKI